MHPVTSGFSLDMRGEIGRRRWLSPVEDTNGRAVELDTP
jgi:hypothetical protein